MAGDYFQRAVIVGDYQNWMINVVVTVTALWTCVPMQRLIDGSWLRIR